MAKKKKKAQASPIVDIPDQNGINSSNFGKIDPLSAAAPKSDPLQMCIVELAEVIDFTDIPLEQKVMCLGWIAGRTLARSASLEQYFLLSEVFEANLSSTLKHHLKLTFQ